MQLYRHLCDVYGTVETVHVRRKIYFVAEIIHSLHHIQTIQIEVKRKDQN